MSGQADLSPSPNATSHVARFVAAIILLVVISLVGLAIDNRELALKRRISLDTFRADQLEMKAVQLRLQVEQLQSPERLKLALEPEDQRSR
jgi:hypothetical protein